MYKYDAFISYRHADLDKFAAETLHRQLEAFRLPANLRKGRVGRKRIERVFRDKDELPLTNNLEDPIMQALRDSEYLIVICSPRLRESLWCRKEIEAFIKMHGRENVLAVLIEGEPAESFPDELLYAEETVIRPDGTVGTVRKAMEPLAADIRGKDRAAMKKALKTEILRLLAPIFKLDYDDLRQRHRERRLKRVLTVALAAGAVCLAFGTVSTVMALQIRSRNEKIEAQNQDIQAQNEEIREQNEMIRQQYDQLLRQQAVTLAEEALRLLQEGDREEAVRTAVSALTDYEGNQMPHTSEAQYALTESLHVYDTGAYIKPQYQFKTAGTVRQIRVSEDQKHLAALDSSGTYTVWDLETKEQVLEVTIPAAYLHDDGSFAFLGNDRFVYIAEEGKAVIQDLSGPDTVTLETEESVSGVYTGRDENRLLVRAGSGLFLYDADTARLLDSYIASETGGMSRTAGIDSGVCLLGESRYCVFMESRYEEGSFLNADRKILRIWDLETGEIFSRESDADYLAQAAYRDGKIYLVLNSVSDDGTSFQAEAEAFNASDGKVIWERHLPDVYAEHLFLPIVEGAENLLLCSADEAELLSLRDGSVYASFAMPDSISGGAIFVNSDRFLLLTRSGQLHYIDVTDKMDYVMSQRFQCHSQNVMYFGVVSDGWAVLPYQSNRITIYGYSMGEGLKLGSREETQLPIGEIRYSDAVKLAEEKGLPKASLAQYAFYNEDDSLLFVDYADNTLEIYQTQDMTLVGTLSETESDIVEYLGKDSEGDMFVRGPSYGYMLSGDGRLLAVIEALQEIDPEQNLLYLRSGEGTCYEVPVYTVEELLEIAEESMVR